MDLARVRECLRRIRETDAELGKELEEPPQGSPAASPASDEAPGGGPRRLAPETIVLRTGRPVLAIANDEAKLIFNASDSRVWKQRLESAAGMLTPVIRAVGRVEVQGHPTHDWLGTGWLVAPDVIVTNRHVAREFGQASGGTFVFRRSLLRRMRANVDFLEEAGNSAERVARVLSILHIEGENGPDLAFLRVQGGGLGQPIPIFTGAVTPQRQVAVIGYPARDSRIPDQALMDEIFGDIYNKKVWRRGRFRRIRRGLSYCTIARRWAGTPARWCWTWRRVKRSACISPGAFWRRTSQCRAPWWPIGCGRCCGARRVRG